MNITLLSGGVGGAKLARGLANLDRVTLTIIVNTGDDDTDYGLDVSPDLDTMLYALAGIEGSQGWGTRDDTFTVMDHMNQLGIDTSFRVGDRDLALKLFRTQELRRGRPLSDITSQICQSLGVDAQVLPMSDNQIRTKLRTDATTWRAFRDYFVNRGYQDEILEIDFVGADTATAAPGVIEAITNSDAVVIAPSNPILSVWPILRVPGISEAVRSRQVACVSPLFGGLALKGPAHRSLASLGLGEGNEGVLTAYDGIVHDFVIDAGDASDRSALESATRRVHVHDTRLDTLETSTQFAQWLVDAVLS